MGGSQAGVSIGVIGGAAALAFVLVPVARRAALRLGVIDRPDPGRKSHLAPVPYLGGVGVAVAVVIAATLGGGLRVLPAVLPAMVIASVGLVDDLRELSPRVRLLAEAAAASAVWWWTPLHQQHPGLFGLTLCVAFLVIGANSFNLIDNADGAAGAVGAATAGGLLVAALVMGSAPAPALAAAVAGGMVGFLLWNWYPARVFMGDAGSLFVGFLLIELILRLPLRGTGGTRLVAGLLFVAPVIFDTGLVVISRVRAGRSIFVGGCDHTSHRLNQLGVRPPAVAALLGVVAAASTGIALAVARGILSADVAAAAAVLAAGAFWVELLRVPVYGTVDAEVTAAAPTELAAEPVSLA